MLKKGIEGHIFPVMSQLAPVDIIGSRIHFFGFVFNLVARYEEELGFGIYEAFDQPGAGDAIDFDFFTCDPFHSLRLPEPCCGAILQP